MTDSTTDSATAANDGLSNESLRKSAKEHVWLHSVPWSEIDLPTGLKLMRSGSGARLVDADGKTYLDGMSGLWLVNVGYGREEIVHPVALGGVEVRIADIFPAA